MLNTIPKENLHLIKGNMLGEGSIRLAKNREGKYYGETKYSMTVDTYTLSDLTHLYEKIYGQNSSSGLHAYPNILLPQHLNKTISQYSFSTRSHP